MGQDRTEYVCLVGGAGWGAEGTAPQEVTDRVAHSAPALATTVGASMMRQGLEKAAASVWRGQRQETTHGGLCRSLTSWQTDEVLHFRESRQRMLDVTNSL